MLASYRTKHLPPRERGGDLDAVPFDRRFLYPSAHEKQQDCRKRTIAMTPDPVCIAGSSFFSCRVSALAHHCQIPAKLGRLSVRRSEIMDGDRPTSRGALPRNAAQRSNRGAQKFHSSARHFGHPTSLDVKYHVTEHKGRRLDPGKNATNEARVKMLP
jgi:hypothetical protein